MTAHMSVDSSTSSQMSYISLSHYLANVRILNILKAQDLPNSLRSLESKAFCDQSAEHETLPQADGRLVLQFFDPRQTEEPLQTGYH